MTIYRLTNWHDGTLDFGYRLPDDDVSRLEQCYVDDHALDCLNRVVAGPLRGTRDLWSAELCLRSLIFHDRVTLLKPCYQEHYVTDAMEEPLVFTRGEDVTYQAIQKVLEHAGFHTGLCTVDILTRFRDELVAKASIDTHERGRKHLLEKEVLELSRGVPPPVGWMNRGKGTYVQVANTPEEYFRQEYRSSEVLMRQFLREIPTTGLCAYFADEAYQRHLTHIGKHNPTTFFASLDDGWKKARDVLDYIVRIPVYPLIAIVLNRATNRESIPDEVIALREEFSSPREQLWRHFDDAQLRSTKSPEAALHILNTIEKEAAQIVPKALRGDGRWYPFHFQFMRRFVMMDWVGMLGGLSTQALSGLMSSLHFVDAAQLLSHHLSAIDWENITSKHFSDSEHAVLM